jgi:hypothetical protein
VIHALGTKFGDLTLIKRIPGSRRLKTKTVWVLQCTCGVITQSQSSNITSGRMTSCGNHGRGFGRKATHEVRSYQAVHQQLRVKRGSASEYSCIDCGNSAHHWSYDGIDNREHLSNDKGHLLAYSTDLYGHYDPRCARCHTEYDKAVRGAENIVLVALGRAS